MPFGFSTLSTASSGRSLNSPKLARVTEPIIPLWEGLVFFEGTYWQARFHDPNCQTTVYPGQKVEVIDRELLTLLVMPIYLDAVPPQPLATASANPSSDSQLNDWVKRLGGFLSSPLD